MVVPKKILLDNSVRSLARSFARSITVSQLHLGYENPLLLFEISKARDSREQFKQDQLETLPSIADLASAGKIELYTSTELVWEVWKNSRVPYFDIGDLLADLVVGDVPAPVNRAKCGHIDPFDKNDSDYLKQFVSWLLKPDYIECLLEMAEKNNLTKFEIANLNNVDVLCDICKPIVYTHFGDAFHLWTASVNQMDLFLTADKKFSNVVTQNGSKLFSCPPIFPTELIELFEIRELKELHLNMVLNTFFVELDMMGRFVCNKMQSLNIRLYMHEWMQPTFNSSRRPFVYDERDIRLSGEDL